MDQVDDPTEVFAEHRPALFGLAYRMLGSVADAEDVVQETWLRWDRADRDQVSTPRAYLMRIVARAAFDHLRAASTVRETYVGPWLPEPLLDDAGLLAPDTADRVTLAESVSMAMLVVLETLSPLERAVFVLREAFGFRYGEIAAMVGSSDQAVRQVGHRAREHVRSRQPRFEADRAARRRATEQFMRAAASGDLDALLAVLAPDVSLVTDGGGVVRAPRREIVGALKVARFFAGIADDIPVGSSSRVADVNGVPAAIVSVAGVPYAVFALDITESGEVGRIMFLANPAKLTGVSPGRDAAGDLET